ncbi:MAG: hypothetical protein NTU79_17315 [Planctomycetota bacterium]|nr:hypothetical protein [Planctomycetota bacterium]
MDASTYEQADIIHDLNVPVPDNLKAQFDVVFDGGTMEHVFNYPQAIKNAMEMVKIGGRLMLYFPANNWCGHGFYQFSPELMYRMLSENNGYKMEHVYAHGKGDRWYSVVDPEVVQERVELNRERCTTYLLVQARRTTEKPIFHDLPQQSDYVAKWQIDATYRQRAIGQWIDAHFPEFVGMWLRHGMARLRNSWNHRGTLRYGKHFTPVKLLTK